MTNRISLIAHQGVRQDWSLRAEVVMLLISASGRRISHHCLLKSAAQPHPVSKFASAIHRTLDLLSVQLARILLRKST